MGTDIFGWVEIRENDWWSPVIKVNHIVPRAYDAFGCLFGVQNFARFDPIAARRGLPDELSYYLKHEIAQLAREEDFPEGFSREDAWSLSTAQTQALLLGAGFHDPTWIHWTEIRDIDFDEAAAGTDARLTRYKRAEDGTLVLDGKSLWNRAMREAGFEMQAVLKHPPLWPEGQTCETAEYVFRAERRIRREALDDDWLFLFRLIEALAEHYGDEHVRMVVWFGS